MQAERRFVYVLLPCHSSFETFGRLTHVYLPMIVIVTKLAVCAMEC